MSLVPPYVFKPDTLAKSSELNTNFADVYTRLEGVAAAASGADVYQPGVIGSTDWQSPTVTVNAGTGGISFTSLGGAAWLPGVLGALVRVFVAAGPLGPFVPPVLPGNGKYLNVGVELTASGSAATVSLVSGAEQATQAEAFAAPAAVSTGKVRILDVIVLNTAGAYSKAGANDRRPWALGAFALMVRTGGSMTLSTPAVAALDGAFQMRVECSGRPVELVVAGTLMNGAGSAQVLNLGFRMDGVRVDGITDGSAVRADLPAGAQLPVTVRYFLTPAAGSHLFVPTGFSTGATGKLYAEATKPAFFAVRELLPSANNGTG